MAKHLPFKASILFACMLLATAAIADSLEEQARGSLRVPIAGSATTGAAFAGTLTIERFQANGNQVVAIGIVQGTVSGVGTGLVGEVSLPVQVAATAAATTGSTSLAMPQRAAPQQAATCTPLNLSVGAVNLNVAGAQIVTQPISIVVSGDSSAPLGNLVCTALSTVNNVVGLVGTLNQILGTLTSLVGGLVP